MQSNVARAHNKQGVLIIFGSKDVLHLKSLV